MDIGIGLYGINGHQIHRLIENHPQAKLVAIAAFPNEVLSPALRDDPNIRHYQTLDEMLQDPRVGLVSLCSPHRRTQADDAIACLEAGKHVYAEKPCALTEEQLDRIIQTARRTGRRFHEMAGTAFDQPYLSMRAIAQSGVIGEVVQIFAQKSYPYHDRRPQDENVDGGLIMQCGIHAMRFIEHVAGRRIRNIAATESSLGNPREGGLKMAASYMIELENGGVASVVANYLNPQGMGKWGNEHLRIFGTLGFVESVDGGTKTRLVVGGQDLGEIDRSEPPTEYFDLIVNSILDNAPMPFTLEDELHPTRMVIRAKQSADPQWN